eukprot:1811129-Pyramimonas_sp.AAC.1
MPRRGAASSRGPSGRPPARPQAERQVISRRGRPHWAMTLARQRHAPQTTVSQRQGRCLSFVEAAALSDTTVKHCAAHAQRRVNWCLGAGLLWSATQEHDVILTGFLAPPP